MTLTKLEEVSNYLQANDKHGEYTQLIKEAKQGDIEVSIVQEIFTRVLTEWKEDLETIEQPTESDLSDIQKLQELINYIN